MQELRDAIEPDLKARVMEMRMRAADLSLMAADLAELVRDHVYFYHADPPPDERPDWKEQREAIALTLQETAQAMVEAHQELVSLSLVGEPLGSKPTMLD